MQRISRWRPSPAMVVAMIALFAALSGTAAALHGHNKVKSDDIKNGQVKKQDLHDGAAIPAKVDLVRSSTASTAVTTSQGSPVNLGGPSVKVRVPAGALVAVFAQVEMDIPGSGNTANVHLDSPGVVSNAKILSTGSNALQTRRTTPGIPGTANLGTASKVQGGWLVFPVPAGSHTFTLNYSRSGSGTATFQNRSLYVGVVR